MSDQNMDLLSLGYRSRELGDPVALKLVPQTQKMSLHLCKSTSDPTDLSFFCR